jgi:hypothetical protein
MRFRQTAYAHDYIRDMVPVNKFSSVLKTFVVFGVGKLERLVVVGI